MAAPSPKSITYVQFTYLFSIYQSVIRRVYSSKIKDAKKLAQALEDDGWRYEELPKVLEERRAGKEVSGMEKDELERLVRWKITHGTHRPFLPALIRKNDPQFVKTTTTAAFTASTTAGTNNSGHAFPSQPLKTLIALSGVGPATATLILSVADAENVPFFQDELFDWLCGGVGKLKYNMKEYTGLYEKVAELRKRMKSGGNDVRADEVDKVGFVIGHWDLLEDTERMGLEEILAGSREEGATHNEETEAGRDGGADGKLSGNRDSENRKNTSTPVTATDKEKSEKISGVKSAKGSSSATPHRKRKADADAAAATASTTTAESPPPVRRSRRLK